MMKYARLGVVVAFAFASFAHAALFSLSGNDRFGSNWFYNLDAHSGANLDPADPTKHTASNTTSYLEHRLLIRPDVLVDERFAVKSEFSLISQNTFDDVVSNQNQANAHNGGAGFGKPQKNDANSNQAVAVRYAYFQWNSDVGVFRGGRMPKGWGLGLLYDEGLKVEDEASTIVDRIGFEGQLGSLVLNAGFEKYQEGNLNDDIDDEELYEGSVKYENEGSGVQIGLLFGRHIRGATSAGKQQLPNPYNSSNDYSFFAKKEWDTFTIGGEFASVSYDSQPDVYGALGQMRWKPGNWEVELDGVFSSQAGGHAFLVHPNYRPFLILFHQSQGANIGANNNRFGRGVGFDPSDAGDYDATTKTYGPPHERGAILGRLGAFYNFSQKKYKLGLVGGYAKMLDSNTGGDVLGIETDLHFEQKWYDNFKTAAVAGIFLPGTAFDPNKQPSWGLQLRSYLDF